MITLIEHKSGRLKIDLSKPLDISMPLRHGKKNVTAWGLKAPTIKPERHEDTVFSVAKGASVNFNTITFNPHSHGTHTETVGHITKKKYPITKYLKRFFFTAEVVSISPEILGEDSVISKQLIKNALRNKTPEALVIRTLPNKKTKKNQHYTNTNPTYLLEETADYLKAIGVKHLLVDIPSIDKEVDNGKLLAHRAFWNTAGTLRLNATITEFIYVPKCVLDGNYMLDLQIAPFRNDAAPSRPILYKIMDVSVTCSVTQKNRL